MAENASKKQTLLKMQMREILGNAYSFVRGRQYTQTISNITYEELLDKAIDRIEGTQGRSDVRGTILDRIKKIKNEIVSAVDTVKKQPTTYWGLSSDDRTTPADSQNTEEGSETV
jgi:hypothetical protein